MRSESTDSTLSPGPGATAWTRGAARMAAVCAGWRRTWTAWWRTCTAWWQGRPRAARDRELAFVLTVLSFAEPLAGVGARFGDLPTRHAPVLAVLLALGQTLPLAVRAVRPALCLTLVGLSFGVHQSLGLPQTFASMGLYLALYSVGAHAERGRRLLVVPAVAAYATLSVVLHARGAPQPPQDYVVIGLVLAAFWGGGAVVRGRRAAEAERRRLVAVAATAAERSRLARELHDVVTHHVTAMVVQSDAAPFLMATPERVTEALAAISGTGRRALAELRYLLGVLEATGESAADGSVPMPDAAPGGSAPGGSKPGRSAPGSRAPARGDLRDLVEQTRRGGQPVDLTEEGKRLPLSIGADLTVYRLVQESLTNAVKYASGRPTRVTVGYGREHVDVEVANDGPDDHTRQGIGEAHGHGRHPAPGPRHISGGRGLGGLRERVRMLGGDFTAGPRADGGFSVRARIPTGGDA
ncbi:MULTISPECIES: sensor histidine kinase [Streptomyces]|uniref:sensor histidine kinase n=1 Tax=Streptomyces lycopersici TaxID=2974589 RepID=UPI0021D1FE71|nr:histidine kinase [Streptomyces sp. NEAU-383]